MNNSNFNFQTPLVTLIILTALLIFMNIDSIFPRHGKAYITSEMKTWAFLCLGITFVVFIFVNIKNFYNETSSDTPDKSLSNINVKKEITDYLEILKGMSSEELGLAVLSALTFRKNFLRKNNVDLMDPLLVLNQNPDIVINLCQAYEKVIEDNKPYLGVPLAIWIHTLRSIENPIIRSIGRQVWNELSRGFPHCRSKRESYNTIYGNKSSMELVGKFPKGLEPMISELSNKNKPKTKEKKIITKSEKSKKLLEYKELYKKGLITKDALTKLQIELISEDKNL